MPGLISRHIRSNVVGYVAVFIALGGSAYAGTANSVNSGDIIDNQVKSVDVRDDTLSGGGLQAVDLRTGSVGGAEIAANAVGGAKIIDRSVTGLDIAGNTIQGGNIASGQVDTTDIADGTIVGLDLAPSALAAEGWHEVGATGEPALQTHADCQWKNYDAAPGFNSAAFLRDRHGFVHLKGLVDVDDFQSGCTFSSVIDRGIFELPPGYRPAAREVLTSISNDTLARIDVWGPAGVQNAGTVVAGSATSASNARQWVSLDGLSFRCAPSGVNGCP